jgi:hypothetical protein
MGELLGRPVESVRRVPTNYLCEVREKDADDDEYIIIRAAVFA